MKQKSWYYRPTAGHETHRQGVVADEATGRDVAVVYDGDADGAMLASAPELAAVLESCVAFLESWGSEALNSKVKRETLCRAFGGQAYTARAAIRKARGEG